MSLAVVRNLSSARALRTAQDVVPTSGSRRNFADSGLRSLFSVRKARKVVFTDPTRGLPATPVRVRLTAWLDHRARTWPATINPYLFVGNKSAPRLVPVGRQFPWTNTGVRPQALREDRILQEIHATGGDIRRICDLFDITVQTALRYANTLGHPDLAQPPATSPTPDLA